MKTDLTTWMERGFYLPRFMRDHHDQKDIFKAMHRIVDVKGNKYAAPVDWCTGQCYVVDIFLWLMAKRGYTLQRSRSRFEFRDMDADVAAVKAETARAFAAILNGVDSPNADAPAGAEAREGEG